jgi:hypothetical protein
MAMSSPSQTKNGAARATPVGPVRLDRRTFLKSVTGAATIWLPPLDAMLNGNGTAHADGEPLAKRFIEFFWGVSYSTVNGDRTWAPRPTSGPLPPALPYYFNTDARYQAKLKALADQGANDLRPEHLTPSLSDPGIRKYVRIIDGITTRHLVAEANQHWQALIGVVTMPRGSQQYSSANARPTGPTLDRFIGSFARFRMGVAPHVHLAVVPVANYGGVSTSSQEHRVSIGYAGMKDGKFDPGAQQLREQARWDPLQVFEEMFGAIKPGAEDAQARRRRSVLDGVLAASQPTLARVSARDRQVIDSHLESIRQIEKNLTATQSCARPAPPKSARTVRDGQTVFLQDLSNRTAPRVAKDMRDLAALMIKCDYTRCLTFVVTPALSGFDAQSFIDFSSATGPRAVSSLHRDSHDAKPFHRLTTPWHMGQLAAFIQAVEAVREGAGSALDNTLIWATSEHGPQVHSLDNIATIVAGGPRLVGGNHYDRPSTDLRPMADMHLGLLEALGLPAADYLAHVRPANPRPIDVRAT